MDGDRKMRMVFVPSLCPFQKADRAYVLDEFGRHEETRTPDLYRVKFLFNCNSLKPCAPMATDCTEKHSKATLVRVQHPRPHPHQ
jgi:hypothetical protein